MWNFDLYPDRVAAVTDTGETLTYRELVRASAQLQQAVGSRCLVFALCTNSIGSLVGYVGFLRGRIVPLLLDSRLDAEALTYLIDTYKPQYLWAPAALQTQLSQCEVVYKAYNYVLLNTGLLEGYPLYNELALLLTTSGSTGSPKLVRQSYGNIEANTESIVEYLHLGENERPITTLPMSYTYGLSIINSHLDVGATILLTEKTLMNKGFWEFFRVQEATSFGGVPYTYEILDKLRFYRMNLPSLTNMTQAGGRLAPELHQKLATFALETNRQFVVMYGQTEATARMTYLAPEKSLEKCGSIGKAIPGGKLALIDSDGNEIRVADAVGELVYAGPNVTLGYAQCGHDLEKGDERLGRLATGDMAKMDDEGYFYIVGRKSRFLKVFGNRINLDEVEGLVNRQFPGVNCACCGYDDNLYLFVTSGDMLRAVKDFVANKTNLNHVAFKVLAIAEIPKNEAGKVLYASLKQYCA